MSATVYSRWQDADVALVSPLYVAAVARYSLCLSFIDTSPAVSTAPRFITVAA